MLSVKLSETELKELQIVLRFLINAIDKRISISLADDYKDPIDRTSYRIHIKSESSGDDYRFIYQFEDNNRIKNTWKLANQILRQSCLGQNCPLYSLLWENDEPSFQAIEEYFESRK